MTSNRPQIVDGLSPRGRGNPGVVAAFIACVGSIPAWAGEPGRDDIRLSISPVYPRVGGGTSVASHPRSSSIGLSPRGRGNPATVKLPVAGCGSIPAWAGEPALPSLLPRLFSVYPRVGGGTEVKQLDQWQELGGHGKPRVYPRVGGGTATTTVRAPELLGLSPRGRGNPVTALGHHDSFRSIPAWAGEPLRRWPSETTASVYPRVGGGTGECSDKPGDSYGLSPRGRGNPYGPRQR